jgi:hypothetical protein
MTGNKTREPTLAEVMKEIKKYKDETTKYKDETIKGIIGESKKAMLLTLAAFGASIVFFGLSYFWQRITSTWGIGLTTIPIVAVGLLVMIEAALIANRMKKDSKDK